MNIHHPAQIIELFLLLGGLAIGLAKHGQPREERYNFWLGLISFSIVFSVLWWGGFWR